MKHFLKQIFGTNTYTVQIEGFNAISGLDDIRAEELCLLAIKCNRHFQIRKDH